ncbi:DNRLRE domain-containing protein [Marinisporobacter balticus]|uniref:Tetratricopeptide repeat protein n=1 Tax=Marinisporobacter balticus TaxID=2018667 RepID=A0A4R2KLY0_9FIRM|nr:DNRLRE domain-containing protein [Marinisporobacter balticus]TCO73632.1 tetratricopeptide repeat protein [Marinisporobacter balticus]
MIKIIEQSPFKDAAINSSMPYENYGDYYALFVGKYMKHSIYRSLLYFDLPALEGIGRVNKVELHLYIVRNDNPSCKKEFQIYRMTEGFEENTVNYANQPIIDEVLYQAFTINEEINTYVKVDITKLFNDWYCRIYPNYGLLVKASDENSNPMVAFYSKDNDDEIYIPKLQIEFNKFEEKDKTIVTKNIENKNINPVIFYNMGNKYFEDRDYKNAYEYYKEGFEKFIPKEKYSPKLLFRMVKTLDQLERYEEGLKIIDQGLEYYSDFTDLIFLRATLYYKQNKISLAIKEFNKCLDMGESPIYLNFIEGAGSFRAYDALAQIYYELKDYDECYHYCKKVLQVNPKFIDPLHTIMKILFNEQRDINDIKEKLESFFGTNLDGKEYITLADVYFEQRKYEIAYEYLIKAEEMIGFSSKHFYRKGMCLLFLKNYKESYKTFEKIKKGELYEKAIYKMVLCEILSGNMYNATKLLNMVRNPENNNTRKVYYALKNTLEGKNYEIISDDQEESKQFTDIIFELLNIIIEATSPENFEKSLQLLNLIENDEVLLRLAKLYYHHGLDNIAYEEFARSIKLFDQIDYEGLNMMKKIFLKNKLGTK